MVRLLEAPAPNLLNIEFSQSNPQGCRHFRQGCPPWFSLGLLQLGHGGLADTHLRSKLSLGDPQVFTPCSNNGRIPEDMRFDNRLRDAGGMDFLTLQPRADALEFFPGNKDKSRLSLILNFLIISMCFHLVFLPLRYG